ncbi:M61 family metallopeptidase [Piscinibacter koreensis]|uniref:M61 family metallopeptidase n=1 Tax=Piscinibacter koreensis TaxID=2742824 RepID=A0A7Y6TXF8_9BURK|nr:PDZ domain-containing protein [Schlegelella koreensis]NUZ07010.1 M61 family metallopeptidase [Schlegelella koreensis]
MISYRIDVADVHAHQFGVALSVSTPAREQRVSMPAWIPGSYLIREFGRHVSALIATQRGVAVPLRQLDKATWIATCDPATPLVLTYRVYAFDTSVRAAFLDADRGFFNGTSVCLRVEGRENDEHRLEIGALPAGWQVATTLRPAPIPKGGSAYRAGDYDELVDHPVELGRFWRGSFVARGIPHEMVVAGAWPDFDGEKLLEDTRRICETEIAFWHGEAAVAPFERYLFLVNAVDDGHGGLEHRASTALLVPRRDLPRRGADAAASADGYVGLLGLVSHEYFHTWNVKRLRPRDFTRLDYTRENYTELLWFFEGFTSYYDDLFVLRSGLVDPTRYLGIVAKNVAGVLGTPGRLLQPVAQASFDAWVKYYRADENTPNATISYYAKGALVALALDLTLRTEGRGSLDAVMTRLWQTSAGGPIDEADIAAALEQVGGRSYGHELAAWVHGTGELPLRALLERIGVEWRLQPATLAQRLGVRVAESPLTGVKISHVLRGGAGERAGLSAGDELLAVSGWRVRRLDDALRVWPASGDATLLVARDQRVLELAATLPGTDHASVAAGLVLKPAADPTPAALALRRAWLGG